MNIICGDRITIHSGKSAECLLLCMWLQLYNLSPESERKEFLDKLFDFMEKKGNHLLFYCSLIKSGLNMAIVSHSVYAFNITIARLTYTV